MARFYPEKKTDMQRLYRRLHVDGRDDGKLRKQVDVLSKRAEEQTDITVCYRMGEKVFRTGIPAVDACRVQIVCLVYAGDQPAAGGKLACVAENQLETGKNNLLDLFFLDGIGSERIFRASEQLNEYLAKYFCQQGIFLTAPYFPGDGTVSLECQRDLLEIIKEEEQVGVNISSGMMLVPEKSLLYAFGADENNKRRLWEHNCGQCHDFSCSFRSLNI